MTIPITVLMSVYNGERFLKESISSVLNQTFTDFEFIIINDGSSDNSTNIIREFSLIDKRIHIVNKQNTGLTNSLNKGIEMANGKWIARVDDDDVCDLKRLEIQYSYAISKKSIVLIGSDFASIDEKGSQLKIYRYPSDHNRLKKLLLKKKFSFPHSSYFIERQSIKKINGYNERMKRSQDYDLCLRLSEIGQISSIQKPLVNIRKHKYQLSNEDNGMRQLVDSRVAFVGYLLRQKRLEDPTSNKSSDNLFKEFYNFIKKDSNFNKFFKYRLFIKELKLNILNFNYIKVLILLIKSINFIFFYFFFHLINQDIEMQLLKKWIKRKSLCVD